MVDILSSGDAHMAQGAACCIHLLTRHPEQDIAQALAACPADTVQQLLQYLQPRQPESWDTDQFAVSAASSIILRLSKTPEGVQLLQQHDLTPLIDQAFVQHGHEYYVPGLHTLDLQEAIENLSCDPDGRVALVPYVQQLLAAADHTAGNYQHVHCTAMEALAAACMSGPAGLLAVVPHSAAIAALLLQWPVALAADDVSGCCLRILAAGLSIAQVLLQSSVAYTIVHRHMLDVLLFFAR